MKKKIECTKIEMGIASPTSVFETGTTIVKLFFGQNGKLQEQFVNSDEFKALNEYVNIDNGGVYVDLAIKKESLRSLSPDTALETLALLNRLFDCEELDILWKNQKNPVLKKFAFDKVTPIFEDVQLKLIEPFAIEVSSSPQTFSQLYSVPVNASSEVQNAFSTPIDEKVEIEDDSIEDDLIEDDSIEVNQITPNSSTPTYSRLYPNLQSPSHRPYNPLPYILSPSSAVTNTFFSMHKDEEDDNYSLAIEIPSTQSHIAGNQVAPIRNPHVVNTSPATEVSLSTDETPLLPDHMPSLPPSSALNTDVILPTADLNTAPAPEQSLESRAGSDMPSREHNLSVRDQIQSMSDVFGELKGEYANKWPALLPLAAHLEKMAKGTSDKNELERLLTLAQKTRRLAYFATFNEKGLTDLIEQYKKDVETLEVNSPSWKKLGYLMLTFAAAVVLSCGLTLATAGSAGVLSLFGMWAIHKGGKNISEEAKCFADEVKIHASSIKTG